MAVDPSNLAGGLAEDPAVRHALDQTGFGPLRHLREVDSTNRLLLDEAAAGAPAGAVAVADVQHAGRGRLGRTWVAPPGASLLVSVLLRPALEPARLGLVPITAGIAAAEAVAQTTDERVHPQLKWPNDLVIGSHKLAGILAEATGDAVVLGMGLNVNWEPSDVPEELSGIATALSLVDARPAPSRGALLAAWLIRWHGWLEVLAAPAGPARVVAAWTRRSATLGREVRVEQARETVVGTAVAMSDEGHLVVDTATGRREIAAGDVVHVR